MVSGIKFALLRLALLGGIAGTITDAVVKDVAHFIITDIQIYERAADGVVVEEKLNSKLSQDTNIVKGMYNQQKNITGSVTKLE